jgi:hypothetical protein
MTLARKLLIALGVVLLVPIVAIGTLLVASGYSEKPSQVFGGGKLVNGELVTGPEPDWGFARDLPTIELQLLDPPRSRVIWVVEYQGKPYVISGYMSSRIGRLWKRWPAQAERDGRAVVRMAGKRYERTLKRIKTGAEVEGIAAELRRKYRYGVTPADIEAGSTWLFELAPRNPGTSGASN